MHYVECLDKLLNLEILYESVEIGYEFIQLRLISCGIKIT
jgi:hypothetical protein